MAKKELQRLQTGIEALIPDRNWVPQGYEEQTPAAADGNKEEEIETLPEDIIDTIEDEELKAALHAKRMKNRGRPRKNAPAQKRKWDDDYVRFCTVFRRDQLAKLREISFRQTLTIKELFEAILDEAISGYESRFGEVIPTQREDEGDRSERAAYLFRTGSRKRK